ncbi:hypothetical protein [Mucilaginibacter aquatilis]|uniref:hypothetical protein n=1 Tax=Mucilaginibacter aquatilis TaxID=1517760 RepID=UPI0018DD1ED3|nr:hypothetical protein [Mucilaginibacter aquatilis]
MKNQENLTNNGQGSTTADRKFANQREVQKSKGVSNSGGQPSFVTSNKDSDRGQKNKK